MTGYNSIDELFYGNLRPTERGIRDNSDLSIAMKMQVRHEEWLRQNLAGEAEDHLEKLLLADSEVMDIMNRECFRAGFQTAARLMIDAVAPESDNLSE